jgi:hypothetical protein
VGVAHGHGQGGMAEDLLEGRQVTCRHHEVARGAVSEIVEPEGLGLGVLAGCGSW